MDLKGYCPFLSFLPAVLADLKMEMGFDYLLLEFTILVVAPSAPLDRCSFEVDERGFVIRDAP